MASVPDTLAAAQAYGLGVTMPPPAAPETAPAPLVSDEQELWRRWHGRREPQARQQLAELYVSYARALAAKSYSRRVHNEFEFDEYLHFAVVGMLESLDRFDPGRGAIFKTFATPRINGAILNGLETLSERQQQVGMRRRLAHERLESLKGDGLPTDRGEQLLHQLSEIGIGLALGFLLEGTGMMASAEDALPDNAYAQLELRQLQDRIWQLVEQTTLREGQVIRRHYRQQQSFDEIAHELKLTKGRVSQLHRQALTRLRQMMEAAQGDAAW